MKRTVQQQIDYYRFRRPTYSRTLREQMEAGLLGAENTMDVPAEMPLTGEDDEKAQALLDAAGAVLNDESLSPSEKRARMLAILQGEDGAPGSGEGDAPMSGVHSEGRRGRGAASRFLEADRQGPAPITAEQLRRHYAVDQPATRLTEGRTLPPDLNDGPALAGYLQT